MLRLVGGQDGPEDRDDEVLLAQVRAWVEERGRTDLEPVLACKLGLPDPRLDRWHCDELVEIVLDLLPRRLAAEGLLVPSAAEALGEFLTWLSNSGLLRPDSDPASALSAEIERLVGLFPAVAVACWRYGFSEADASPGLPPMTVVHGEALETLAASAPALVQLRELVRFVGEGRRLTAAGNLRVADGGELVRLLGTDDPFAAWQPQGYRTGSTAQLPEVDLLFRWALRAGFLQVEGTRVVPGPAAGELVEQPLEGWRRATMTLFEIGVLSSWYWGYRRPWRPPWTEPLDDIIIHWLYARYCDGVAMPVAVLSRELGAYLARTDPEMLTTFKLIALAEDLQAIWDGLATLDLIRWDTAPLGPDGPVGPAVRLSPLGQWLIRPLLIVEHNKIPLACELVGTDAETLLALCRGWDWPLAEAAIAAWAAHRGLAAAAGELGDFARHTTDVFSRSVAFRALGGLGRDAEPVVRALREVPHCQIDATDWLVKRGLSEPVVYAPEDVREMLAEKMAMVLEVAGAERMVRTLTAADSPQLQQSALIESLWEAREPHIPAVLEAVAALAPEPLAKAARKALLRRRTHAVE